jgi:hypothetical protein
MRKECISTSLFYAKNNNKMLNKIKIYLDTSVISCLHTPDTPERMADSLRLWKDLEAGIYDVFISETTIDEINDCHEP